MKKLAFAQMEKIEGGKFWGTSCTTGEAAIFNAETGDFDIYPWKYCCSYIFWINTGCEYVDVA